MIIILFYIFIELVLLLTELLSHPGESCQRAAPVAQKEAERVAAAFRFAIVSRLTLAGFARRHRCTRSISLT